MSNSLTTGSSDKAWYQKPENITSGIFLAVISYIAYNYGVGLFSGLLNLVGFAITLGICAIVVGFLITQRKLIGTIWNVLMYKLTNAIYKIDPIAIAWQRLNSLKERALKILNAKTKLSGSLKNIQAQIQSNEKDIETWKTEILALTRQEKDRLADSNRPPIDNKMKKELIANKIARAQKWNEDLIPIQDTLANMKVGIGKLHEVAEFVIQDKEDELKNLEQRYESVKIGWGAVKDAQGIYGKNSQERQDIEKLISIAGTDMNNKLAAMDEFINEAAPIIMQADIEKSMNDIKAQDIIERLTNGELINNIQSTNTQSPSEQKKQLELDKASVSKNTINKGSEVVKIHASSTSTEEKSDYDVLN